MAGNPQEDVMKRLMGIKDARGPVGALARGKNMYPGGNAARTGSGPNIGRPAMGEGMPGQQDAESAIKQAMKRMQLSQKGGVQSSAPQGAEQALMRQRGVMQNNAGSNMPNANAAAPAQANAIERMQKQEAMQNKQATQGGMQGIAKDKAAKLASVSMQAAAKRKMQQTKNVESSSRQQRDLANKLKRVQG